MPSTTMERVIPDIFDDLEIGITVHDPETGEILAVNEQLEELYGHTEAQLREMDVADYSATEGGFTQAEAERRIRAAAEGEPQTFEWQIRRSTDELVWVRVRLAATTLDGEEYVVAEIRDITERKERERELREERAFIESIIEALPEVFYAFDEHGQFYEWNERVAEVTGYSDEEIAEMTPMEFFPESEQDRISELIADIVHTESSHRIESEYLTKDGERIPYEFSGGPLYDAEGNIEGIAGIGRDITERKERERELEATKERLDTVISNVPIILFALDSDGVFALSEGQGLDALGLEPGAVVGQSIFDVYGDQSDIIEAVERALDGEEVRKVVEMGGQSFDTALQPVTEHGETTGVIGVSTNVTERKKRENEIERSNERLQQFAYVLSHDLQEPLRMVSSYVDLLEVELADALDEETREYMDFAVDGAERMQAMIDGLLQYSRVETRGGEFEPTDAGDVLDDVRRDLQLKLDEAGAEVIAGDLPTVRADSQQLGQLFQNLLKNAVDHGGAGTTVEITAEETADAHEFRVTDDGPGIPDDEQGDIFGLFETGGDSDGTGIGLAICERIVDRHGGTIRVDSTDGEGTTFVFTLPKRAD